MSAADRYSNRSAKPVKVGLKGKRGLDQQGDYKSAYGGKPPKRHKPTSGGTNR